MKGLGSIGRGKLVCESGIGDGIWSLFGVKEEWFGGKMEREARKRAARGLQCG